MPVLSNYIMGRNPSAIRVASMKFAERPDANKIQAINTAIGNVSLPMHPAMIERMKSLGGKSSPFAEGVVKYSSTVGLYETREAFRNIISSSKGCHAENLHIQITDGGSQAMELMMLACCGLAGTQEDPLLMIDAAYPNYKSGAKRLGRHVVSCRRSLDADGNFVIPPIHEIEDIIKHWHPKALLIIPYDNPTGQLYTHKIIVELAKLCVANDMWLVSDEAYRELHYRGTEMAASIWTLTEEEVPGITGRRVSIETASKVWNACGLRIGALVTDNKEMHDRCVAENTFGLCSNVIGQWIFGALAHLSAEELGKWYQHQRDYYRPMMVKLAQELKEKLPGVIVSLPQAALYEVIDVRNLVDEDFDPLEFVTWCATEGTAEIDGQLYTLLTAPMASFYDQIPGVPNPGRTQMRVAFVESPKNMALVPRLFAELLTKYINR